MADLEFTGGIDFSEALTSLDDLAGGATASLSDVSAAFAASLSEAGASALAEIAGATPEIPITADVAPAEASVTGLVSTTDGTTATIAVDADTSEAQAAVDDLGASAESSGGKVEGFGESAALVGGTAALARGEVGGLGEVIKGAGIGSATAVGGIAALGASIFELGQKGIEATSAEQRFNTIVGETADQVERVKVGSLTADLGKLGLQFGSTDTDMKNTASTLFQFALNSGAGREEAAKFTDQVIALSARAVSLNPALGNLGDVADSLGVKIARGGRFAASYGIALTATEINARALDNTHKTAAADLTIYEKATAATQLAVEKYGSSLGGTVAEGAKNAANEQKSFKAQLDQMLEEIAKPLVAPLFDAIRSSIPDVVAIAKPLGEIGVAILPAIAAAAGLAAPPLQIIADAISSVPGPVLTAGVALVVLSGVFDAVTGSAVAGAESEGLFAAATSALAADVTLASISFGTAIPLVGAFVAGVAIGKEIFSHLGLGPRDFGKALDEEDRAAQAAAKSTGDELPKAFKRLEQAAHDAQNGGTSPLNDELRAFRDLADINIDKAAKFANSQDHQSDVFRGMVGVLNSVIDKKNADAEASGKQGDALQQVTQKVDITSAAFQSGASEFGFYAAAAASAGTLTADALGGLAKHAADLDQSTSSAFASATSIVSKFGTATSVSVDELISSLNDSVGAAQRWSINLTTLAHQGVDQGLIEELRQAGPKAEPLIEGLLQAVASGNLDTINNAESSLRTLLSNTNSDLDAMELQAAIHMSNIQAVVEARAADLESGGTSHLDALRDKGDADLKTLAESAEQQMGRVGAAINSVPDRDIYVNINVREAIAGGVPDVAGMQAFIDSQSGLAGLQPLVDFLSSLGQTRAAGGPVVAGTPYLVGEDGPELFAPTMNGTIYPQGAAWTSGQAGAGSDTIHIEKVVLEQATPNPTREAMRGARQLRHGAALAGLG